MNSTNVQVKFCEPVSQTQAALQEMTVGEHHLPGVVSLDTSSKAGDAGETAKSNSRLVEALAASATFREYQRAFGEVTGLPLTLRAVEGWQLAHQGSRRQNGFCALM
jgi:hypothetical protein